MKFPMVAFFTRRPIPSLGGRMVRYKPVVPIEITGPTASLMTRALVDPAADDVVFPWDMAARLGVDLSGAPQLSATGAVSASPATLTFAPIILRLWDRVETCRWRATVAFTQAPLKIALLGVAGGLEHFRAIFIFRSNELELIPEPTLPTTQAPAP